jgi:hypothetical protein
MKILTKTIAVQIHNYVLIKQKRKTTIFVHNVSQLTELKFNKNSSIQENQWLNFDLGSTNGF